MKAETIVLNEKRNVTLTAYLQETGGEFAFDKRPAMIVIPGGGYAMCIVSRIWKSVKTETMHQFLQ